MKAYIEMKKAPARRSRLSKSGKGLGIRPECTRTILLHLVPYLSNILQKTLYTGRYPEYRRASFDGGSVCLLMIGKKTLRKNCIGLSLGETLCIAFVESNKIAKSIMALIVYVAIVKKMPRCGIQTVPTLPVRIGATFKASSEGGTPVPDSDCFDGVGDVRGACTISKWCVANGIAGAFKAVTPGGVLD